MTLRLSNISDEGVYQASKWLKIQVLLDPEEMKQLLEAVSKFWIFPLTGMGEGKEISQTFFLEEYTRWILGLQQGIVPSSEQLRRLMACVWTDDLEALWLQEVAGGKFLTKISRPVVQVQTHYFSYSELDNVFRPMSMGQGSIFWGIQFSFPQIFQHPKTMELCEVEEGALFRKIQLWMREMTRATPFVVGGKRINSPIRLGKQCFSWIHQHPQLFEQHINIFS